MDAEPKPTPQEALAYLRQRLSTPGHFTHIMIQRWALEAVEQQIATLTEALEKHGQHGDGCEAWPQFTGHFTQATQVGACTCGFSAALATVRGETR